MRLKIFVVPFSILVSLILAIGYIKPDITTLQERQVLLETKTTQAENMSTLLSNIDTLTTALVGPQSDASELVSAYVPQAMDQERTIDMFNYLASQSGVFVSGMNMSELALKSAAEEGAIIPDASTGTTVPVVAVSLRPKVQAYVAEVEVKGSYDSIRDFLQRVSHMNRYHKIISFSVEAATDESAEATAGILTGKLQSQFDYFPLQQLETALNVPVFSKSELNTEEISALISWVSYSVPPLMKPMVGRPNPFQL